LARHGDAKDGRGGVGIHPEVLDHGLRLVTAD